MSLNLFHVPRDYHLPYFFGMTCPPEQSFCWHHAKSAFSGEGEWIELGTFLGSLTIPSALGLRLNPNTTAQSSKIRVFDLFQFDHWMQTCTKGTAFEDLVPADTCYLDEYQKVVHPVRDQLEITKCDLSTFNYSGEPIEFLLLDVIKDHGVARQVTEQFLPRLIPGRSVIVQQDYLHFLEGWITLQMFSLRNHLRPGSLPHPSGTASFHLVSEPDSYPTFPEDVSEIDPQWMLDAFEWSRSIVPDSYHPCVLATEAMMRLRCGDVEGAVAIDYNLTQWGFDQHYEVLRFREYVTSEYPGVLGDWTQDS